jgi:hypothetical protein
MDATPDDTVGWLFPSARPHLRTENWLKLGSADLAEKWQRILNAGVM